MKEKQGEGPEQLDSRLLVTVDEAAHRLAIGRSHVYEQIQRGTLRSIRIGRSRRILNHDLDAFVEELLQDKSAVTGTVISTRPQRPVKRLPFKTGRR